MLDDYAQPGLYDTEFKALLKRMVKCSCGMIMMQRVFKAHRCAKSLFKPIKKQRMNHSDSEDSRGDSGVGSGDSEADAEESQG